MSVQTALPLPEQDSLAIGQIHQGDCLELMRKMEAGTVDLVFADPPFNIGFQYDEYHDEQDPEEYVAWSRAWISEVHRVLKPGGSFWLAIGDEYAAELKVAAEHQVEFVARSWVVWYYTFGVNCKRKFSRSHAHLLHFVKDQNNFTFNAEDPQVRVPSARALVYGDKRANPGGRLPDDTWILRPQDLPEGFQPTDDTWYYARVAGTFKERQGFHGCQMPEQLLGRIVRVSSNPGDVVLDPFSGSGTTLAVAKKLGRQWIGCELSEEYVRAATERLSGINSGDTLDGAADPIASAPSTANGRRLNGHDRDLAARSAAAEKSTQTSEAASEVKTPTPAKPSKANVRDAIRQAVIESYYSANDGYSIDWLLANPPMQTKFHEACHAAGLIGGAADWNRELLRIRKAGELPKRGQTNKIHVTDEEFDVYGFAAEIGWRLASDKFAEASLDEIFCDPEKAAVFDRAAKRFASGFTATQYRWAALRLRKASRDLVNEVKKYHFVFAKRDFDRFRAWSATSAKRIGSQRGVYLLRDASKEPLYIGSALDLGQRLALHATCSQLADLAPQVSIITGDELPSAEYQDAFKEYLVRVYQPRWNVNLVGF